jgi:hypothetical protein
MQSYPDISPCAVEHGEDQWGLQKSDHRRVVFIPPYEETDSSQIYSWEGEKMEKTTLGNKDKNRKDFVDWNTKIFEDIREGMFENMCLDEMIQWVEQKLRECQ